MLVYSRTRLATRASLARLPETGLDDLSSSTKLYTARMSTGEGRTGTRTVSARLTRSVSALPRAAAGASITTQSTPRDGRNPPEWTAAPWIGGFAAERAPSHERLAS